MSATGLIGVVIASMVIVRRMEPFLRLSKTKPLAKRPGLKASWSVLERTAIGGQK